MSEDLKPSGFTPGPSTARWEAANIFGTWYVEWVSGRRSHTVTVAQGEDGSPLVLPSKLAAEKKARSLNRAAIAKATGQ